MQTSNLLAFVAILVAVLAAIYARRSAGAADRSVVEARRTANETRRANRIAMHEGRIGVLKGLLALRGQLLPHGGAMEPKVLWTFHDHVVLAEFFFAAEIHAEMEALERDLGDLVETHGRFDINAPQPVRAPLAAKDAELFTRCKDSVERIEKSMKVELRKVARELT